MVELQFNLFDLMEVRVIFNFEGLEFFNSMEVNSVESGFSEYKVEKIYVFVCSSCQGEMKLQYQLLLNIVMRLCYYSDGGILFWVVVYRYGCDIESEGGRYYRGRGYYRG